MTDGLARDPVARSFLLLDVMIEDGREWGVRELATRVNLPPSTAHRLLNGLAVLGMVREREGRYSLGAELLRLARRASATHDLSSARPHLLKLVEHVNESVIFGMFDAPNYRYSLVHSVNSSHALRYVQTLYEWVPLHVGAIGIAILSTFDDAALERYLSHHDPAAFTDRTPTTDEEISGEVRRAQDAGFALTRGHKLPGAVGIAAPVFGLVDGARSVVGAISLTIPEHRFDDARADEFAAAVKLCAQAISEEIGG